MRASRLMRVALTGVMTATLWLGVAMTPAIAAPIAVVQVTGGKVRGIKTDVEGVQIFKGVPFAASTAGENRWRAPQPVVAWDGVRTADTWGDQALQDVNLNPVGGFWGDEFYYDKAFLPKASEDGLNLNVYTPAKAVDDKLPVYVWIHGGGNDHGYASELEFWGSKLAAKGIVLVQVQYRVGPTGFLALQELSAESPQKVSGNYALLDLVESLKWVKANIANFGGDPSQVTVGGQSAGGRNTVTLLKTPLAKGLFNRVVVQSGFGGVLPQPFKTLKEAEVDNAASAEKIFGKTMSLADLRAVKADEFFTQKVGEKSLFMAWDAAVNEFIIDGVTLTNESVDLLRPGALDGIDILIGGTSNERASQWGHPDKVLNDTEFTTVMTKLYGDDSYKSAYKPSNPHEAYRLTVKSDSEYRFQEFLISAQYAKNNNKDSNVFAYYFDHAPPGRNSEFYGAFHSADLWYFFNSIRDEPGQRHWLDADYRTADMMSSYLANFIKNGNPNGTGLPEWPQPETAPNLLRFADGYAYSVTETPSPSRDAVNRNAILKKHGIDPSKLVK